MVWRNKGKFFRTLVNQKFLILMSFPFVIWAVIFCYVPLWGWTMAFQNYKPGKTFFNQQWVGFQQFVDLFHDRNFLPVLRNTLAMSVLGLVLGFFIPIVFALLLNEIKNMAFKRTTQTISYLPHFVSWVVAANIVTTMLSTEGPINALLLNLHIIDKAFPFLTNKYLFWFIVVFADIWKETGWNAIIYLASIAGIDQEQYEAARVDGASRLQQIFYITLPGIRPTIVVLLILSIGQLLNTGFEKQFLLQNSLVQDYSRVLDLFALEYGIGMTRYSFGTAIGIFKSVVSVTLLLIFNGISRRVDQGSVM